MGSVRHPRNDLRMSIASVSSRRELRPCKAPFSPHSISLPFEGILKSLTMSHHLLAAPLHCGTGKCLFLCNIFVCKLFASACTPSSCCTLKSPPRNIASVSLMLTMLHPSSMESPPRRSLGTCPDVRACDKQQTCLIRENVDDIVHNKLTKRE